MTEFYEDDDAEENETAFNPADYLNDDTLEIEDDNLSTDDVVKIIKYLDRFDCPVRHLIIKNAMLNDEDAGILADHLKKKQRSTAVPLQSMCLDGNDISDEGARALFQSLKKNNRLDSLSLDDNNIGDGGFEGLAECLQGNVALSHLSLSGNKIYDGGADKIAQALAGNNSLQELYLDRNAIEDGGAMHIAAALKTSRLNILSLEENKIDDDGAVKFAHALKNNKFLMSLNLAANQIHDTGAVALGEALPENDMLIALRLNNNSIADDGARGIAKGWAANKTLSELYIDENRIEGEYSMGDAGIKSLCDAALVRDTPNFYALDVTSSGAAQLLDKRIALNAKKGEELYKKICDQAELPKGQKPLLAPADIANIKASVPLLMHIAAYSDYMLDAAAELAKKLEKALSSSGLKMDMPPILKQHIRGSQQTVAA